MNSSVFTLPIPQHILETPSTDCSSHIRRHWSKALDRQNSTHVHSTAYVKFLFTLKKLCRNIGKEYTSARPRLANTEPSELSGTFLRAQMGPQDMEELFTPTALHGILHSVSGWSTMTLGKRVSTPPHLSPVMSEGQVALTQKWAPKMKEHRFKLKIPLAIW